MPDAHPTMARGILDSSPIRGAPPPSKPRMEPLKRSASTASLPTPPQTVRKRKRGASRASSHASSVDTQDLDALDDRTDILTAGKVLSFSPGTKKGPPSTGGTELSGADDENPFWQADRDGSRQLATARSRSKGQAAMSSIQEEFDEDEQDEEDESGLLNQHLKQNTQSLVSPPPSRRQTMVLPKTPTRRKEGRQVAPLPTRVTRSSGLLLQPSRDSPDNPFLDDSPQSVAEGPLEPRTPTPTPGQPFQEAETTTWVFRGVRRVYPNPHYAKSQSAQERAKLPFGHRDYSPDPTDGAARLLFPKETLRAQRRTAARAPVKEKSKGRAKDDGWGTTDDEKEATPPPVMAKTKPKTKAKAAVVATTTMVTKSKKVVAVPAPAGPPKIARNKSAATLDRMIGKPESSSSIISITEQRRLRMQAKRENRH